MSWVAPWCHFQALASCVRACSRLLCVSEQVLVRLLLVSASVAVGVLLLCCFRVNNDVQVGAGVASGVHVHACRCGPAAPCASNIPTMCILCLRWVAGL